LRANPRGQPCVADVIDLAQGRLRACGTSYYGLIFQSGCNQGGLEAARLDGFDERRPMSGGGVCSLK
jgi:hypothetical protein